MTEPNVQGKSPSPVNDPLAGEASRFFASLQQRVEQLRESEAAMAARAEQIARQEAELREKRAANEADHQRLMEESQARLGALERREGELSQREIDLAAQLQDADRLLAEGEARAATLATREKDVATQLEQTARVLADLEQRAAKLDRESHDVRQAREQLAAREQQHAAAVAAAENARVETEASAAEIKARAQVMAQVKKDIDQRRFEAEAQLAEAESRMAAAARYKDELDAREGALVDRENDLRTNAAEIDRRRAFSAEAEVRIAQAEAATRHLREQAEQIKFAAETEVRKLRTELAEERARAEQVQAAEESWTEQRLGLEIAASEAQERAQALEAELAEAKAGKLEADELAARLGRESAELEDARRVIAAAEAMAAAAGAEVLELKNELERAGQQAEANEMKLSQMSARLFEAQSAAAAMTGEGGEPGEEAEALAAEVAVLKARLDEAVAGLSAERQRAASLVPAEQVEALTRQASEARAAADALRAQIAFAEQSHSAELAELRRSLEESHAAVTAGADDADAIDVEREAHISQLQDRVRTLEGLLEQATAAGATQQADQAGETIARLKEAVEEREGALRNLAARIAAMQEQAAARSEDEEAAHIESDGEFGAERRGHDSTAPNRRERLTRYRAALRSRNEKLGAAFTALKHKESMMDRVIEQRVNSALAAAALTPKPAPEPVPAKLTFDPSPKAGEAALAQRGPSSVMALAACAVIAACVTPLAYFAARPLMGYEYAASTVIKANTGGLEPTSQELTLWNRRHLNLAKDNTEVYDLAAKKFDQMGVRQLSQFDAVRSYFQSRLTIKDDVQGQLTLELRGDAPEATERALRAFTEAVQSLANARRQQQNNAYSTDVPAPAAAMLEPIDNRMVTAHKLLAAGAGLGAALAAWAVHSRRAKRGGKVDVNPSLPADFAERKPNSKSGRKSFGKSAA